MADKAEVLDIAAVIGSQAFAVAQRFKPHADQEDLQQEAWVWVLEHPAKVKEHQANEDVRLAAYRLGQDIWGVMDRYARREKAQKAGYEPEDEMFASDAVINVVLPAVLKGDPTPPARDGERVANTSDPAEGGGWLATFMDVKLAWERADLTDQQRALLVSYYRDEMTQAEIASTLKLGQPAVTRRLKQARAKLIDQLGGPKPPEPDAQYRSRPGAKGQDDDTLAAIR